MNFRQLRLLALGGAFLALAGPASAATLLDTPASPMFLAGVASVGSVIILGGAKIATLYNRRMTIARRLILRHYAGRVGRGTL